MKISVALATYNGEKHLRAQLDSIKLQTLQPLEVVVSDDGSTDGTLDVVRDFANGVDFDVRILSKEKNLGFADNFLFCASHCAGDLIALCDQDDVWHPEKLQVAHDRMVKDDSLLAMHTLLMVDNDLVSSGEVWTQDIKNDDVIEAVTLFPYKTGWGNSMMVRASLLKRVFHLTRPLQPEGGGRRLSHDTWIYTLACALGRTSHINRPLIYYRQHGNNVSQTKTRSYRDKLRLKFRVSMEPMLERQNFYKSMADILDTIAFASETGGTDNAKRAAQIYQGMHDEIKRRTDVYFNANLTSRLAAYSTLIACRSTSTGQKLKDALFGVTGFGLVLRRKQ